MQTKLIVLVALLVVVVSTSLVVADGKPATKSRPTLDDIGGDTADLPDSPFTVPRGSVMYEPSLTRQRDKDAARTRTLFSPTLIRIGLADTWELRLSGDGFVNQQTVGNRVTGLGDSTIGFKKHLCASRNGGPALGIIVQTSVPTARRGLGSGRMEPFASLNVGQQLWGGWSTEVNFGGSLLNGAPNKKRFLQGNLLYVVERNLGKGWGFFVHGQYDAPSAPGSGPSNVVGPGFTYRLGSYTQLDASFIVGTTRNSPNQIARLGIAILR